MTSEMLLADILFTSENSESFARNLIRNLYKIQSITSELTTREKLLKGIIETQAIQINKEH